MVKRFLPLVASLVVPAIAVAQSNETWRGWEGPGPWHMWAGGWGFWWVFPLFMLIVFGLCVFFMMGRHRHFGHPEGTSADSALRILRERFARGEINKNEYEEKKSTLRE
jgi:putative membrane protein